MEVFIEVEESHPRPFTTIFFVNVLIGIALDSRTVTVIKDFDKATLYEWRKNVFKIFFTVSVIVTEVDFVET